MMSRMQTAFFQPSRTAADLQTVGGLNDAACVVSLSMIFSISPKDTEEACWAKTPEKESQSCADFFKKRLTPLFLLACYCWAYSISPWTKAESGKSEKLNEVYSMMKCENLFCCDSFHSSHVLFGLNKKTFFDHDGSLTFVTGWAGLLQAPWKMLLYCETKLWLRPSPFIVGNPSAAEKIHIWNL